MGTVHWIGIEVQCSMQIANPLLQKNIQSDLIKLKKYLIQLGLQWMSPSKERANVFEKAVVANDIF